jgi:formiminoglutamase
MSLHIFFEPIREAVIPETKGTTLGKLLHINTDEYPDWEAADIVFIGITESRGTKHTGIEKSANAIRKELYKLKKSGKDYKIADMGNLINGETLEDTYIRLKEVVSQIVQSGKIAVIIGGSQDMTLPQYWAYEHIEQKVCVFNADATFDIASTPENGMNKHFLYRLFSHQPDYLFSYTQAAYQTYLTDITILQGLDSLYYNLLRLGKLREDLTLVEPYLRESEIFTFDVSVVKQADAPGCVENHPFGITAEEACQLAWYAGISDKITSAGFYEYIPDLDVRNQTAGIIATMIWYFIEGYYSRTPIASFDSNVFQKFSVNIAGQENALIFYKHLVSNKWWLEVPYFHENNEKQTTQQYYVPCSYADYLTAVKGEIPDRWINTHTKLI